MYISSDQSSSPFFLLNKKYSTVCNCIQGEGYHSCKNKTKHIYVNLTNNNKYNNEFNLIALFKVKKINENN